MLSYFWTVNPPRANLPQGTRGSQGHAAPRDHLQRTTEVGQWANPHPDGSSGLTLHSNVREKCRRFVKATEHTAVRVVSPICMCAHKLLPPDGQVHVALSARAIATQKPTHQPRDQGAMLWYQGHRAMPSMRKSPSNYTHVKCRLQFHKCEKYR